MKPDSTSPYLLAEPPTSTGRAFLARAMEHWCTLHYGYSRSEIAAAFGQAVPLEHAVAENVRFSVRMIGELIAAGRLQTFARPFGGGRLLPIPEEDWELDDFTQRFAKSAMDPVRPFAADADPTHWIFIELSGFNEIIEASCADVRPLERAARLVREIAPESPTSGVGGSPGDGHVRLPEVMRRTGMSRSTIYRRIKEGRFPKQIEMDGNIASWREAEVADWLASPQ